ncbi:MAG: hypothetical protein K9M81_03045 [Chthoniobacterales bacterium]|nr:hypothetical protein [Chthoniobacterales bacterium]
MLYKYFPLILILFALCYYGSYYRCSLYPSGEGGVEGVTALRLLSGKTPIIDVALNYNVLWFYPIVWLFKIVGPSYTALRIFFFVIATITGLLAFFIVKKSTHFQWLALLAGILALLLPGQLFRNYMAFVVMMNMFLFLKTFTLPCHSLKKHLLWMFTTGCSLGITFLIRIDLGFFLSSLFLGILLLYPWIRNEQSEYFSFKKRFFLALAALSLGLIGFLLTHIPIYFHAEKKGFVVPFITQYGQWPRMIVSQGTHLLTTILENHGSTRSTATYLSTPKVSTIEGAPIKSNLLRPSLDSVTIRERITTLNIYLPIICIGLLLAIIVLLFFLGVRKKDSYLSHRGWVFIVMLGCSLTLFPQYFFWRPDMVHLSEFMVPMTTTLLVALFFVWEMRKKIVFIFQPLIWTFLFFSILDLTLYFINGSQSQSTGGIAISQGRKKEFIGANGVHVKLAPHEFEEASAIAQSILKHSKPGEYVLCFPYNPEINFMTDRPSYRRDLYCDDMTASSKFDENTIAEIECHQPAVIVITDWPINGTEHSRFSNWANTTYRYIQSHYQADYENGIIHVFVRPTL